MRNAVAPTRSMMTIAADGTPKITAGTTSPNDDEICDGMTCSTSFVRWIGPRTGDLALSISRKIGVRMTKANSKDFVTRSDLECQRLVRDVIMTEFPNDKFWGEEDIDDTRR